MAHDATGSGKRTGRPQVNAATGRASDLFHIVDAYSGRGFLVDSGAAISIIATRQDAFHSKAPIKLHTVDGTVIPSGNFQPLNVKLGSEIFSWKFLEADISRNILGADFLAAFRLLIDMHGKRLISTTGHSAIPMRPENPAHRIRMNAIFEGNFGHLYADFPSLIAPSLSPAQVPPEITCEIRTEGGPVYCRPRPLPPEKYKAMKEEFRALESLGIVRRSKSAWASPLHVVPKSDGTWRPCGDYRRLNQLTRPDRYPLPLLLDFSKYLSNCAIFSKIDLVKSYHQIAVRAEDVCKTAVSTPFGSFEYLRMPFGLRNAAQTFQRVVDVVTRGLDGIFAYVDDILVASANAADHEKHLRALFQRLSEYNLTINREKSQLGVASLSFLGHFIDEQGLRPLQERVEAIAAIRVPRTVKEVQSFVGSVIFYHRFLPRIAATLRPLHRLTAGKKRSSAPVEWTAVEQDAFEAAKRALKDATLLAHFDPVAETRLVTDASDAALGGVLEQRQPAGWRPVAFYSRALRPAETNYSTYDRELLAVCETIKKFRHFVDGRPFYVATDHRPLVSAITKVTDPVSGRQQRQLSYIAEFTSDIRYLKGEDNVVADMLSRATVGAVVMGLDLAEVARAQAGDQDTARLRASSTIETEAAVLPDGQLLWQVVRGSDRPVIIPPAFRRSVIETAHNLAHPGVRATQILVRRTTFWPRQRSDVAAFVRSCDRCQRSKVQRHIKAPLQRFEPADARFSHVHVDLVGPLVESDGFKYMLTMIDRFSRWMEAVPLKSSQAVEVAAAFCAGWVSRFGAPNHITSDRGTEFTNTLWTGMAEGFGAVLHRTTAHHPQANGMVERLHRRIKESLRARLDGNSRWTEQLPWVLLGLRTAAVAGVEVSPAELVYGVPLALPALAVPRKTEGEPSRQFLEDRRGHVPGLPLPPRWHGIQEPFVPTALATAKHVFVRRPHPLGAGLAPQYDGPFPVNERGEKTFRIQLPNGEQTISVDRLKPAAAFSNNNIYFSPVVSISKGGGV